MSEHTPEAIIAEIPKNARETILVTTSEFNGHRLASIRVWVPLPNGDGRLPTKTGIAFRRELLPDIIRALQRCMEGQ